MELIISILYHFGNIPYENINSIGKHWVRRFSLSLCKEILGLVRSKFSNIMIPGENITLNGESLLSQAKEEKDKLKEELKEILDQTSYTELAKRTLELSDATNETLKNYPMAIVKG